MTTKAKRELISLAGIEIEVFQLPDGEYVMNQAQVARAVDEHRNSVLRFIRSISVNSLPSNSSECYSLAVDGLNSRVSIVPIEMVRKFWLERAMKGNIKALALISACMEETLQRRCDNVFCITKTEHQYEQQTADWFEKWQQTRQYLSEQHNGFTRACDDYGFSPARTHDALAIAACGMTARELRKLEKVCGDKGVGLNHIEDIDTLKHVARVKYHFSRYRKGTVAERITRAIKDAHKEKNTL
ncbi:MAG: hypothetical protein KME40_17885 [Komarekiella atlantica HA4396-MV6]|jgi:hypothetical protein|nr:hypothetical protein [Komarekiella atlantica HA4396-MV6]